MLGDAPTPRDGMNDNEALQATRVKRRKRLAAVTECSVRNDRNLSPDPSNGPGEYGDSLT
jgi:hypothetical protein